MDTDSYDIEMDVKWRSYKLPGRMWSGGLMDLRFAIKNQASGEPYLLRITDPKYEAKRLELSQTQAQIDANNRAKALRNYRSKLLKRIFPYLSSRKSRFRDLEATFETLWCWIL